MTDKDKWLGVIATVIFAVSVLVVLSVLLANLFSHPLAYYLDLISTKAALIAARARGMSQSKEFADSVWIVAYLVSVCVAGVLVARVLSPLREMLNKPRSLGAVLGRLVRWLRSQR